MSHRHAHKLEAAHWVKAMWMTEKPHAAHTCEVIVLSGIHPTRERMHWRRRASRSDADDGRLGSAAVVPQTEDLWYLLLAVCRVVGFKQSGGRLRI